MTDYRVKLDIYNGPLDLLLYLIRRAEVDIQDIPIATITEQYLHYVELIKQLDLDLAGEFLVMAATLMEIKSAMLLPRDEVPQDAAEDLSDPRMDLVRQLLEYKNFKDRAAQLAARAEEQSERHRRPLTDLKRLRQELQHEQELDIESLQVWHLFDAFQRLMQATLAGKKGHQVFTDDTPIDIYETDILDRAQHQKPLTFAAVFTGRSSRIEMVGLFLALLELIRQKLVRIEQENDFGHIYIFALTDQPAEAAVAHAISASADQLPGRKKPGSKEAPTDALTNENPAHTTNEPPADLPSPDQTQITHQPADPKQNPSEAPETTDPAPQEPADEHS